MMFAALFALFTFLLAAPVSNVTSNRQQAINDANASCENTDNVISCCAGIEEEILIFDIDLEACADITLDWDSLSISLDLTVNNTTLISTEFGVGSEPEICATLGPMEICLGLTDLELDDWNFSGCVSIIINDSNTIDLGCWSIGKEDNEEENK